MRTELFNKIGRQYLLLTMLNTIGQIGLVAAKEDASLTSLKIASLILLAVALFMFIWYLFIHLGEFLLRVGLVFGQVLFTAILGIVYLVITDEQDEGVILVVFSLISILYCFVIIHWNKLFGVNVQRDT